MFGAADVKLIQDYILAGIDGFSAGSVYIHEEPVAPDVYDGQKTLSTV